MAMKLSMHNIEYQPRTIMKGQALANFLLECEPTIEDGILYLIELKNEVCKLDIDRSSNQSGAGIGLYLARLEGFVIKEAILLLFPATNNESEYEVLIVGIMIVKGLCTK